MAELRTTYLGLELKNPIVIASSPLASTLEGLKKCEESGAGAIVLKSIFEEQIEEFIARDIKEHEQYLSHTEAELYYESVSRGFYIQKYLDFIKEAKKNISIPLIGSINCTSLDSWTDYISSIEDAGCDAIELNYYPIAADSKTPGSEVEKQAIRFASEVKKKAKKPVSIKLSHNYSSLSYVIKSMSDVGIDGLVLFNRFLRPDIDIEKIRLEGMQNPLSEKTEFAEPLRWIALTSSEVKCDLAATTGIHDGETIIKFLLSGAKVCQICSAAIKDISVVGKMCYTLQEWMVSHNFERLDDFVGRLAAENVEEGEKWERTQYFKKLSGEEV